MLHANVRHKLTYVYFSTIFSLLRQGTLQNCHCASLPSQQRIATLLFAESALHCTQSTSILLQWSNNEMMWRPWREAAVRYGASRGTGQRNWPKLTWADSEMLHFFRLICLRQEEMIYVRRQVEEMVVETRKYSLWTQQQNFRVRDYDNIPQSN